MLWSLKRARIHVDHIFEKICWESEHVSKPTCIDLKTTNQPGIFRSAKEFEASLSDFS